MCSEGLSIVPKLRPRQIFLVIKLFLVINFYKMINSYEAILIETGVFYQNVLKFSIHNQCQLRIWIKNQCHFSYGKIACKEQKPREISVNNRNNRQKFFWEMLQNLQGNESTFVSIFTTKVPEKRTHVHFPSHFYKIIQNKYLVEHPGIAEWPEVSFVYTEHASERREQFLVLLSVE